jgi:hypothetical protein
MEWDEIDASALFERIRAEAPPADAERMIWALEHILAAAHIDPVLLDHFAAAAICGLAYRDTESPKAVLDQLFRRVVSDEEWESDYAFLLPLGGTDS